jgi:hypothetical protein
MAWKCAYCGAPGKAKWIAVCHHCGRPVCERHRERITDDAFGAGSSASRMAIHCPDCRRCYHPQALAAELGAQETLAP